MCIMCMRIRVTHVYIYIYIYICMQRYIVHSLREDLAGEALEVAVGLAVVLVLRRGGARMPAPPVGCPGFGFDRCPCSTMGNFATCMNSRSRKRSSGIPNSIWCGLSPVSKQTPRATETPSPMVIGQTSSPPGTHETPDAALPPDREIGREQSQNEFVVRVE